MRAVPLLRTLTCLVLLAGAGLPVHWPLVPNAHAATLSSSLQFKVGKIAENIDKTHQRLRDEGSQAVADPMKAKQLRERIESYGRALDKMPSNDDPVLLDAKARHGALVAAFNALATGGAPTETPDTDANSTPASTAASATPSTSTAAAPAAEARPELVSGQRVRVTKLTRDIQAVQADLITSGPSPLQRASEVERYRAALEKYATGLNRYADYAHDPDVVSAARAYQALRQALSAEYQRARAQLDTLGDVQAILANIEASLRASTVPQMLWRPVTDAEATALVVARDDTTRRATDAIAELRRIAPLAYLDKNNPGTVQQGALYDQSDLNRLF
ncbi:MAG: hypothetical protein AAGA11_09440, partial [Pseudomonadota bacterium]